MHILALTRYSRLGPSSRVRFYQYLPYLESHGLDVQFSPLLDDDYIRDLYSGKHTSFYSILSAYIRRISCLVRSRRYDLIWIEKELLPWLPAWAESILDSSKIPYVADYDDAVFHRYDTHPNPFIRTLLGKSIDTIMRRASIVVVGNDYLAEHARLAGARRIEYLPSVVDTDRYKLRVGKTVGYRIGWIGSPVTAPNLRLVEEALREVSKRTDAKLVLVGAGNEDLLPSITKEILPWHEDNEVADISSFDVGIMPLPDTPFTRGKCGYKLIQYMASRLPVIASPVGINARIIDQGETGFLAGSNTEWVEALMRLYNDPKMRIELGRTGRKKVEQEYSLNVSAPHLLEILNSAASHPDTG